MTKEEFKKINALFCEMWKAKGVTKNKRLTEKQESVTHDKEPLAPDGTASVLHTDMTRFDSLKGHQFS